jgi:hypothetical protein
LIAHRPDALTFRVLLSRSLRVCLAGAGMLVCILGLRDTNPILAGIAGGLVYLGLLAVLRAPTSDDWALLWRISARLPVIGPLLTRLRIRIAG